MNKEAFPGPLKEKNFPKRATPTLLAKIRWDMCTRLLRAGLGVGQVGTNPLNKPGLTPPTVGEPTRGIRFRAHACAVRQHICKKELTILSCMCGCIGMPKQRGCQICTQLCYCTYVGTSARQYAEQKWLPNMYRTKGVGLRYRHNWKEIETICKRKKIDIFW